MFTVKIKFPNNIYFERAIKSILYEKEEEQQEYAVYRGVFALDVDREGLNMGIREFIEFCRKIEVEGGRKRRRGDHLFITPYQTRVLAFRLSEEEHQLLKEDAKQLDLKPSEYARRMVLSALAKRLGV